MLSILLSLIVVALGLWEWSRWYNKKNEPPALPGYLPFIGHARLVFGNSIKLWKVVKDLSYQSLKAGGASSGYLGPIRIYLLTDPEDCLTVSNACLQKSGIYDFAKPWIGDGLVTATVPIWTVQRKLLNPAFNQMVLDGFMDVFNKQARRLVEELKVEVGRGSFDHWVYTRQNALETICLTALGVDLTEKTDSNSKFVMATENMFYVIMERILKPWLYNDYIYSWSSLKKKQDEYLKILHNMSYAVLQNRKAEYLKNKDKIEEKSQANREKMCIEENQNKEVELIKSAKFKPFMDLLLELAIEKGAFSDIQIREHVDTIITGGHDTSATVLMYCMLLVGSHPDVQERVFEEIDNVFGDDDRDVTKRDLSRLCYLEAVIKETMRFYTIVPITVRWIDKDVKLRNYTLRKGRTCFIFNHGVHRHPMWGKDAEEFKPERWLSPATLPECATAFAGFSMGKRMCIGKAYAYMSMKTSLAHVFRNYKVKGDHSKLEIKLEVTLKPVSGHHISLEKREKNIID